MSCFEKWDDDLHLEPDQIKRRLNGEKIKANCIMLNRETQTARFVGSGGEIHIASLSDCSCMDFHTRKKPCKHMYRLADELELSEPFPAVDKKAEQAFVQEEADRWREAFLNGRVSAAKYAKVIEALFGK